MSSSKSSANPVTNYADNRNVIGEGAVNAQDGSTVISNSYTLDAEVVNRALAYGNEAGGSALAFGEAALRQNGTNNAQAWAFGADALALGESSLNKVLSYSAANTDRALDNLETTQSMVKDAYADAKGRGALTDKILMGAIVAMAVVAYMAVKK